MSGVLPVLEAAGAVVGLLALGVAVVLLMLPHRVLTVAPEESASGPGVPAVGPLTEHRHVNRILRQDEAGTDVWGCRVCGALVADQEQPAKA